MKCHDGTQWSFFVEKLHCILYSYCNREQHHHTKITPWTCYLLVINTHQHKNKKHSSIQIKQSTSGKRRQTWGVSQRPLQPTEQLVTWQWRTRGSKVLTDLYSLWSIFQTNLAQWQKKPIPSGKNDYYPQECDTAFCTTPLTRIPCLKFSDIKQ